MVCRGPAAEGAELVFDMECSKAQQLREGKRLARKLLQGWEHLSEQDIQVGLVDCSASLTLVSGFNHVPYCS